MISEIVGGAFIGICISYMFVKSRQYKKDFDDMVLVQTKFETNNNVVKATLPDGRTYMTDLVTIRMNPKMWYRSDMNQRRGKLEESLTHFYSLNVLNKTFNESVAATTPKKKETPPKPEGPLN